MTEARPLHIVCLDAPAPPDYGGAIDMYHKIKALASEGWNIHLHYFQYKKGRSAEGLEKVCSTIKTYKRKSWLACSFSGLPYIVASRINSRLLADLNKDEAPVLLEGIHCTGIIPMLKGKRRIVVRMHNDEATYYKRLATTESRLFQRTYFRLEARRLERYQMAFDKSLPLACVAHHDMDILQHHYQFRNLHFIPSFTGWQQLKTPQGLGTFCLYHGNLEVSENREMAAWLIREVFAGWNIPFVIAGKGAGILNKAIPAGSPIHLVPDPPEFLLQQLLQEAQVNLLPSLNATGLKLKMLRAMFEGRHLLTNIAGVSGTEFQFAVHIASDAASYRRKILELMDRPVSQIEIQARLLATAAYSNDINARKLSALLS